MSAYADMNDLEFQMSPRRSRPRNPRYCATLSKTVFLILGSGFLGSIAAYTGLCMTMRIFPPHIEIPVIHIAFQKN